MKYWETLNLFEKIKVLAIENAIKITNNKKSAHILASKAYRTYEEAAKRYRKTHSL